MIADSAMDDLRTKPTLQNMAISGTPDLRYLKKDRCPNEAASATSLSDSSSDSSNDT